MDVQSEENKLVITCSPVTNRRSRVTPCAVILQGAMATDETGHLVLVAKEGIITIQNAYNCAGLFFMTWRTHPKLKGRFHPQHPDDLQVIVHDGGPRISDRAPEAVWVTVLGCDGDVFTGRVLNQPTQLRTIQQHQQIRFIVAAGSEHPVLATEKYLQERPFWRIHPCQRCGFCELFDAPSDLMRVIFPNIPEGAVMDSFTSFCPLCRGVQVIESAQTS